MLKIGLILGSPLLLMALVVGATGVVVVEVHEEGPDGVDIVVPVPLVLAQAALSFAPSEARYIQCPELGKWQDLAERVVAELEDVEDFTLVEVEDRHEHVLIRKVGNSLMVDVTDGDEQVRCRVPLESVGRVLRSYDGDGFSTKSMVWALRDAPRGDLVHVREGGDVVRIRKL